MTGKITRVVEEEGFGVIAGDDGQDYFFRRSALQQGELFDQLLQGAAVTFDAVHGPKGLGAEVIRIVKSDALRASNGELESWGRQRREELKTLIGEANSLGVDVGAKLIEAHELYKSLGRDVNCSLVDADIRSELDCTIAVLKTAIKVKALNRQTAPMQPGAGREKGRK